MSIIKYLFLGILAQGACIAYGMDLCVAPTLSSLPQELVTYNIAPCLSSADVYALSNTSKRFDGVKGLLPLVNNLTEKERLELYIKSAKRNLPNDKDFFGWLASKEDGDARMVRTSILAFCERNSCSWTNAVLNKQLNTWPYNQCTYAGLMWGAKHVDEIIEPQMQKTALHYAASVGNENFVKILICNGAKLDCENMENSTPLHHAAFNRHAPVVQLLCGAGANRTLTDTTGLTPLNYAQANNDHKCIRILSLPQ